MPAQSRHVDVDPEMAPIDLVGPERMPGHVRRAQRRVERADVGAVKSVRKLEDVGPVDINQFARQVRIFLERIDTVLEFAQPSRSVLTYCPYQVDRPLEDARQHLTAQVVGSF